MRAGIGSAEAAPLPPRLVSRIDEEPSAGTPPGRDFSPASVSRVLIMAEGLAGILRWHADMGADIAVDDVPHDRFAESRAGGCPGAEMRRLEAAPPETIE
ncbi:MAG: hypothetical protein WAM10_17905, partial [Methylocella sp.]